MPNFDLIEIAENRYLNWMPIEEGVTPFNIDPLLHETKDLWLTLETRCIASCCGLKAYDFTTLHLNFLLENKPELFSYTKILELKQALESIPETACQSNLLNSIFYKDLFIGILNHFIDGIEKKEKEIA